jgi:hypothetical protein
VLLRQVELALLLKTRARVALAGVSGGLGFTRCGTGVYESRHGPRRVRMMGPHRAGCNLAAKMMGMLVMSAYVGTAAGSPLNSQRSAGWSLRLRGGSADADLAPE